MRTAAGVAQCYDELNRATAVKDALNGNTLTSYDLFGNVIAITDAIASTPAATGYRRSTITTT